MDKVADILSLQDKLASSLVLKWRMEEQLAHYPRVLKAAFSHKGWPQTNFLVIQKKATRKCSFLISNKNFIIESNTKLVLQNRVTDGAIPP